jgi:hypothetical protein
MVAGLIGVGNSVPICILNLRRLDEEYRRSHNQVSLGASQPSGVFLGINWRMESPLAMHIKSCLVMI